jgi:anti-sigma-K factor RskA
MARTISGEEKLLAAGYVLGDLSTSENYKFESTMNNNLEVWAEIYALHVVLNELPLGLIRVAPPDHLKSKIIESFASDRSPDL